MRQTHQAFVFLAQCTSGSSLGPAVDAWRWDVLVWVVLKEEAEEGGGCVGEGRGVRTERRRVRKVELCCSA